MSEWLNPSLFTYPDCGEGSAHLQPRTLLSRKTALKAETTAAYDFCSRGTPAKTLSQIECNECKVHDAESGYDFVPFYSYLVP